MRNLKILFVVENFEIGGVQRIFTTLAKLFSREGCDVVISPLQDKGKLRQELTGIKIIAASRYTSTLKANIFWFRIRRQLTHERSRSKRIRRVLKYAYAISRLINDTKPDIVLSGDMLGNCALAEAKRILGKSAPKILLSLRSHAIEIKTARDAEFILSRGYPGINESNLHRISGPWDRDFVRRCFSMADAFVAASQGLGEEIKSLSSNDKSVTIIPNPVINEKLKLASRIPSNHPWIARKTLPVIISVGRFSPEKDFAMLLDAFAKVRKQLPSRLILVGYNPKSKSQSRYKAMLTDKARAFGISEDVCMEPATTNPYSLMMGSDVYVLSSPAEGFGNVLVEALYCGLPIVSTDCPSGPREILNNGEYGTLIPVGDSDMMAEEIINILNIRPASTEPDKERLRVHAESYSEENVIKSYKSLISDLAAR